jgi:hypothetical protein
LRYQGLDDSSASPTLPEIIDLTTADHQEEKGANTGPSRRPQHEKDATKEGQTKRKRGLTANNSRGAGKRQRPLNKTQLCAPLALEVSPEVQLSQEQSNILALVIDQGKSVFFTGGAGTGKSALLKEIIRRLRASHADDPMSVAVTATTGLAAVRVGGTTIHRFAGLAIKHTGKKESHLEEAVRHIRTRQQQVESWKSVKVLAIDEISMMDGDFFDLLANVAAAIRKPRRLSKPLEPFGGIQLVITGDFFQLGPVANKGERYKYAFEAHQWHKCLHGEHVLTRVFRQKDQGNWPIPVLASPF